MLSTLYASLKLKKTVFDKVVQAHIDVLQYGLDMGNERVIAIDSVTGEIRADETGTPTRVKWFSDPRYTSRLIAVHNHPMSTPFSPTDIFYYGSRKTRCLAVQGHSGIVYVLIKSSDKLFEHTEDKLAALLDIIRLNPVYKNKTEQQKGELFVRLIADDMGWTFLKGGADNG